MSEMDLATLWRHLSQDTPRARRAHRTAQMIMHLVRDFLPRDRECLRRVEDHLLDIAYTSNAELINVPPECDALDKLQLERARLATHPMALPADKIIAS